MPRHSHEFECHCGTFNYPVLDDGMTGNYTIVCGTCKHHHYRAIKAGRITEDRHNHAFDHGDTIHVLSSQTSKTRRPESPVTAFRRLAAAGLAE